jgi:predicted deacylase
MVENMSTQELPWHERQWHIGSLNEIHANGKQAGYIEHGSYADGTPLQTPVHVIVGAEAGPVLYVQAAVHGDEVNGIEVIRRVVTGIDPAQLHGMVIAVPVTNGLGLIQRQRRNPIDEEDMNRIWPGKRGGLTSQQIAYQMYNQAIRHANYVIDLHTANSNTLLHVVYARNDAASRDMAEIFGLEILLEEDISDEELQQARFTGKLRNYLNVHGIAAITPELGGNNYFEEDHIELGVRGVTNVMKHLGMVQGKIELPDHAQITLHGSHLDKVRANQGGIWVAQVNPGQRVTNGQPVGYVYSIRTFEIIEQHVAPYNGYVTGTADMPMVNIGDALVAICRQ